MIYDLQTRTLVPNILNDQNDKQPKRMKSEKLLHAMVHFSDEALALNYFYHNIVLLQERCESAVCGYNLNWAWFAPPHSARPSVISVMRGCS